jgi:hypothetical protein
MSLAEEVEALKTTIRATQADLETGMAMAMTNVEEGELPPVEVTAGATARMLRSELDAVWKAIDIIAASIDDDKTALGF